MFICVDNGKKIGTPCSHANADSLFKTLSFRRKKKIANKKIKNRDNVSFRECLVWIRVILNKVVLFLNLQIKYRSIRHHI